MIITLFILFTALFFDIALLKKCDRSLFTQTFNIAPIKAFLGCLLIISVALASSDPSADLPPIVLLIVVPLYLLGRQQFSEYLKTDCMHSLRILSDALGVIVNWFYGVIVFGLLISSLLDLFEDLISPMGDLVLSALFSSVLIVCLVYFASQKFSNRGFLANVGLRKDDKSSIKVIIIPAVLGLIFAVSSSYLTITRVVQPQTPLNDILETTQSLGLVVVFLFLAICMAPLIEEIVFRGYFYHVVKQWLGTRKAIYIIALTFAVLHVGQYWGDWMAIVMVALLGFTLTLLRAWTDTTLASTITHYVYNACVTIIPVIFIALTNPAYFEYQAYYPYHDAQTKKALLKEAIDNQPDLADAYNELAWLYSEEEINLEQALELVEQALIFAPEHPAYLDTKANVLEKLGRNEEALEIRAYLPAE